MQQDGNRFAQSQRMMRELLDEEQMMAMTLEIYHFRGLQAIVLAWQGY
jgi:hypothetical protein